MKNKKECVVLYSEPAWSCWWETPLTDPRELIPIGSHIGSTFHSTCDDGYLIESLIELETGEVFNVRDIQGRFE